MGHSFSHSHNRRLSRHPLPRLAVLGLLVAAVVALVFALTSGGDGIQVVYAEGDPQMDMTIPDATEECTTKAQNGFKAHTLKQGCSTMEEPDDFDVVVDLNQLNLDGYVGFQAVLTYSGGVDYESADVDWPDCDGSPTITHTTGKVEVSCDIAEGESTYTGDMATVTFTCDADGSIVLDVAGMGQQPADFTHVVDDTSTAQTVNQEADLTIHVDCLPQPTPPPTDTPTPTAKVSPTPVVTPTPVPSPTGALEIDAERYNGTACDVVTDDPIVLRLDDDSSFTVCIFNGTKMNDIAGYQVHAEWDADVLEFDDTPSKPEMDFFNENCSPTQSAGESRQFSNVAGTLDFGAMIPTEGESGDCAADVKLVRMDFSCKMHGSTILELTGPGTDTYFIDADDHETLYTPSVKRVEVRCLDPEVDSDLDGCSNAHEVTNTETWGGLRDPHYFWDLCDTWTDDGEGGWERDGRVDMKDLYAVIARYFMEGDADGDPLATPSTPPATGTPEYHTAYDRGDKIGPYDWNLAPPDGKITVTDILNVVAQYFHRCDEPVPTPTPTPTP